MWNIGILLRDFTVPFCLHTRCRENLKSHNMTLLSLVLHCLCLLSGDSTGPLVERNEEQCSVIQFWWPGPVPFVDKR
jgi:hypothetical protein